MLKIFFNITVALLLMCKIGYCQEVISEFNNETVSVLNDELRKLGLTEQISILSELDMQNKDIVNVASPETSTGAANKNYVDTQIAVNIPTYGDLVDCSAAVAHDNEIATTDGEVIAHAGKGGSAELSGCTDSSDDPTTCPCAFGPATGSIGGGFTMPVKKGDHWKVVVVGGAGYTVYWRPTHN